MKSFTAKPYKLYNKIQHYDWGTKNAEAFIPKFLGIETVPDVPYAELWIGAHPKAPSEINVDGVNIPLNKVIADYPVVCLGESVNRRFNGEFPFLLKVLSSAIALSIQAHPNKAQAEKLHASDPRNYPDANHKPEIAIAFDFLIAIAGFRPVGEIVNNLRLLPELSDFTGKKVIDAVLNETDTVRLENSIKALYAIIMEKAGETEALTACIKRIYERLIGKSVVTKEEELFLRQHALFGADIGLFSFFFFNLLELKNGQAIYTEAGVPHAYIKGNIIECMASSDNVVRAGLTPKFKDVKTLLDIITYGFSKYEVMNSGMNPDVAVYKTPAAEFEISHFEFSAGMGRTVNSFDKPGICLVDRGKISVSWESDGLLETQSYRKGESFFIPACLAEYTVFSHGSASFFSVEIPD